MYPDVEGISLKRSSEFDFINLSDKVMSLKGTKKKKGINLSAFGINNNFKRCITQISRECYSPLCFTVILLQPLNIGVIRE